MEIIKSLFVVLVMISSLALHASPESALLETERNTINIFKSNVKSVVYISNIKLARGGFFDQETMAVPAGAGSGFVWNKKGHIVTNYHVISDGNSFTVRFHKDPKEYKAKFIGGEPKKDIAILQLIDFPKELTPIKIGVSKGLQVGQKALAIGNPFGLDHTLTTGIISALERKIDGFGNVKIYGMIQTDTSINPGNSGGPLLNSAGKLIGMNTMIFSASGSSAGVGFAVPVDTIKRIVPELIKHGKVTRPGLGVGIFTERYNAYFGVRKGIIIKTVLPDSPADKVGLIGIQVNRYRQYQLGDIILSIDDKEVNSYDDIYNILGKYKAGQEVELKVKRGNKLKKIKIKLINVN